MKPYIKYGTTTFEIDEYVYNIDDVCKFLRKNKINYDIIDKSSKKDRSNRYNYEGDSSTFIRLKNYKDEEILKKYLRI
jgi:hypothetical protein